MKINVLELVGDHGGMNIYDKNLGNVLVSLGNKVDFFTYGLDVGNQNEFKFKVKNTFSGIYNKNLLKKIYFSIKGLLHLFFSCVGNRSSIGWANIYTFSLFEYICLFVMYLSNRRLIVIIHDVSSFTNYEKNEPNDYKLLNKMVSLYVVHNNYSKDLLAKYTTKPIGVMNDLSYEELPITKNKIISRKEIGLDNEDLIVSFIGQIKNVKGVDVLIKAIALMKKEKYKVKLMIAGKFWKEEREKYINLISDLDVSDLVYLREGYIDQGQYPVYFWASDIIVLPYKIIYNSAVLIQALGYGSTVVCSDLPPFREFVNRNSSKPMVELFISEDPEDLSAKIKKLLDNKKLREDLKMNAREFIIKEYSFESYKNNLNNILKIIE